MKRFLYTLLLCIPLALNAQYGSKARIYDGFVLINDALEITKMTLEEKSDVLYYNLTRSFQDAGDSAKSFFESGMNLRDEVDEMMLYINELKVFLIAKSEGKKKSEVMANDTIISLKYVDNTDDYLTPTKYLIGDKKYAPKEGPFSAMELKEKLMALQITVDSLVTVNDQKDGVSIGYINNRISEKYDRYWIRNSFFEKPLSAIITYLSKIQVDIKLTEQEAISYLTKSN